MKNKGSWAREPSSRNTSAEAPPTCSGRPRPPARRRPERQRSRPRTSSESTKADYENFSVYFNLDNGTGKIRGVYMQGNEAVRPIFRKWLTPFREMGATTLTISNTGGTDHQSFDGIGLPGFQFIQDEIEYDTPDAPFQPGCLRPHPGRRHEAGCGDHGCLRL